MSLCPTERRGLHPTKRGNRSGVEGEASDVCRRGTQPLLSKPRLRSEGDIMVVLKGNTRPSLDNRVLCLALLFWCTELWVAAKDETGCGGDDELCCSRNTLVPERFEVCCDDPDFCKKCGPDQCCANPRCDECRDRPECKEGEVLRRSGTIDFRFFCKRCPDGAYLDVKRNCCLPWTDCKMFGLQTLTPGSHIDNVKCGSTMPKDFMFTTILAVMTTVGIFFLILMTTFLLFCMWTQKEKLHIVEEGEAANTSSPTELLEETCSCQFPEEEHGGERVEEKASLKS